MASLTTLKKEEIITMLVENHGLAIDDLNNKNRPELLSMLKNQAIDSALDNAQIESGNIDADTQEIEEPIKIPVITDVDWSNYVMSLFDPKLELINGYPSCDGLRRVFEILIGTIISTEMDVIQAPKNDCACAIIKCGITYLPIHSNYTQYAVTGNQTKYISDVAEATLANTDRPFNLYLTATAATMAEGRCLRKALRLRTLSNEEIAGVRSDSAEMTIQQEIATSEPAGLNQKKVIINITSRLNLDLNKIFDTILETKGKNIDSITSIEAQAIIRKLNAYDRGSAQGGEDPPVELFK